MIVRRERTIPADPAAVWSVVSDPARLPQWWPGVARVEEATPEAWTNVLTSPKGKTVRADYTRLEADDPRRLVWRHEVEESPFERILARSTTEIVLAPAGEGTRVEIAVSHQPRGWARLSPFQLRAAATKQVEGALENLGRLLGTGEAA
ncbi:MAG TPA: SRPBCC family protein [Thermoleophilaceae bacterium]|nr:SRPBCC family protein [Thermoleophilaceae bacterium]